MLHKGCDVTTGVWRDFEYPDRSEITRFILTLEFREFDKLDWQGYQGCESKKPMIAHGGNFVVVLDDDCILVNHADDCSGGVQYWVSSRRDE